jgi:hypothetical protein
LQRDLNTMARQGEWQQMGGLIDDDMLAAFAVIAPRSELPTALGRWVQGLADRTSFTPGPAESSEQTAEMIAAVRSAAGDHGTRGGSES